MLAVRREPSATAASISPPWWHLHHSERWSARGVSNMTAMKPDPDAMRQHDLFKLLGGYEVSQALHVAAKLGLGDLLRDGPKTSTEIATSVGADQPSLVRLLRFL